jgi:hypothetical protein
VIYCDLARVSLGIHGKRVANMTSPDQARGGQLDPAIVPVITPAIK